jgi:hypothetical protein
VSHLAPLPPAVRVVGIVVFFVVRLSYMLRVILVRDGLASFKTTVTFGIILQVTEESRKLLGHLASCGTFLQVAASSCEFQDSLSIIQVVEQSCKIAR